MVCERQEVVSSASSAGQVLTQFWMETKVLSMKQKNCQFSSFSMKIISFLLLSQTENKKKLRLKSGTQIKRQRSFKRTQTVKGFKLIAILWLLRPLPLYEKFHNMRPIPWAVLCLCMQNYASFFVRCCRGEKMWVCEERLFHKKGLFLCLRECEGEWEGVRNHPICIHRGEKKESL